MEYIIQMNKAIYGHKGFINHALLALQQLPRKRPRKSMTSHPDKHQNHLMDLVGREILPE